ncbi:MAG: DUF47 family protein [Candidatus Verstraetearchaeota archaeon]|nr:DUF47 family protein [Candidatus Verstraetearchaeota archaeon]
MLRKIRSFPLRGIEEKIKEHQVLVRESVELLRGMIAACKSGDWHSVQAFAEKIASAERDADEVKREIEIRLYKGVLFVGLKEDFLRLMEAMDLMADKAKDAGRILAAREIALSELSSFFEACGRIDGFIDGTVEIVLELERAIDLLDKDSKEALNSAHMVEKAEEKLDELKLQLLMQLTKRESSFSTLTYLQLRDFILTVDMIADAAEGASDVLTAMILKATS